MSCASKDWQYLPFDLQCHSGILLVPIKPPLVDGNSLHMQREPLDNKPEASRAKIFTTLRLKLLHLPETGVHLP